PFVPFPPHSLLTFVFRYLHKLFHKNDQVRVLWIRVRLYGSLLRPYHVRQPPPPAGAERAVQYKEEAQHQQRAGRERHQRQPQLPERRGLL
ncbi:hypothetical protein DL89DRAFT_325266, partial [Linderina pennispora]